MAEQSAEEESDASFELHPIPQPEELESEEDLLNPFPWFKEMRDNEPVRYDEDREVWDIFRYEDVKYVMDTEPEKFNEQPQPLEALRGTPLEPFADTMIQEPPKHSRIRGAATEFFEPGALKDREETIRDAVETVLDEALEDGTNEIDFRTDIAELVPTTVVSSVLGIPLEDRDKIIEWGYARMRAQAVDSTHQDFGQSMQELFGYVNDLIEEKKENPTDDITSELVHKEVGAYGETLTKNELIMLIALLIIAGSATTMNYLTNLIWTLEEEDLLNDVIAGELQQQPIFEEVLRYRGPARTLNRTTIEEVELGGKTIPEGERLELWLSSANRDERQFEDPDEFKPGRTPNHHLGFGSGIHYCLGSPLVRLESQIFFEELFDRVSYMEADLDALEPINSFIVFGTKQLPATVET